MALWRELRPVHRPRLVRAVRLPPRHAGSRRPAVPDAGGDASTRATPGRHGRHRDPQAWRRSMKRPAGRLGVLLHLQQPGAASRADEVDRGFLDEGDAALPLETGGRHGSAERQGNRQARAGERRRQPHARAGAVSSRATNSCRARRPRTRNRSKRASRRSAPSSAEATACRAASSSRPRPAWPPAFVAMNDVYGPLYGVSRAEAATPDMANERAPTA